MTKYAIYSTEFLAGKLEEGDAEGPAAGGAGARAPRSLLRRAAATPDSAKKVNKQICKLIREI